MVEITRVEDYDWAGEGAAADVRRVARAATAHEGVATLNEQAVLQLKYRGLRDAELFVARDGGEAVGFLLRHGEHLVDLAVHPDARRRGVGRALVEAGLPDGARVEAWSHADHPGAAGLARHVGLPRERELRIMRRPLTDLPPVPSVEGVVVRGFEPGDQDDVVAVNAAAFTHHPEQGHMTVEDFCERADEDWFDPAGLLLAVPEPGTDGPPLLGFHWTKGHRDEEPPYGEVYVVAVNPRAAGRGLGTLLTIAGLHHLAATYDSVLLYVDADNEPAVALYSGLGFAVERVEAQYRGTVSR